MKGTIGYWVAIGLFIDDDGRFRTRIPVGQRADGGELARAILFGVSDAVLAGFGGSAPSFITDGEGKVIDGPGISAPGDLDAIKA